MKEKLRNEIIEIAYTLLENGNMQNFCCAIDVVLNDYTIEKKETGIVNYNNETNSIIKKYVACMRLEGLSENTIKQYVRAILSLINDVQKNINDITTNDIRYHLSIYQSKGISKVSVDNKRRFLSSFFAWATINDIIEKNPMIKIKRIKQEKHIKKSFSDNDLEKIRESCSCYKEKCIVEFLLSTGCRVGEISNIKISDIDFHKNECIVYGKGSKERTVYISEKCMYYIEKYLSERTDQSIYLFINSRKGNLSKSSIQGILKKLGNISGVDFVHPHRFRRTFATNAMAKGMPLQYIQAIMGHEKIETTMLYCNINNDYIKYEHQKVS